MQGPPYSKPHSPAITLIDFLMPPLFFSLPDLTCCLPIPMRWLIGLIRGTTIKFSSLAGGTTCTDRPPTSISHTALWPCVAQASPPLPSPAGGHMTSCTSFLPPFDFRRGALPIASLGTGPMYTIRPKEETTDTQMTAHTRAEKRKTNPKRKSGDEPKKDHSG